MKKRIAKIEKGDSIQIYDKDSNRMINGKMMQRKKKGRLYSLGGNDPPKRGPRGRLDRLKTVGTFDLGNDMVDLSEVARNLNEKLISGDIDAAGTILHSRRSSANALLANSNSSNQGSLEHHLQQHRRSCTPGPCRKEINKNLVSFGGKKAFSRDLKYQISSATSTPGGRRIYNTGHGSGNMNITNVPTQHSADDCLEKPKPFADNRKSRSCSTSGILTKADMEMKNVCTAQIHNSNFKDKSHTDVTQTTNFNKKIELKHKVATNNTVNFNVDDSNKIETIHSSDDAITEISKLNRSDLDVDNKECTDDSHINAIITGKLDKDSDKIELDMASAEDSTKNTNEEELIYKPRKPVLRKSKRIVRTDSELFDEAHLMSSTEIVLQPTTHIQIHNEPDYMNENRGSTPKIESRKDSSDFDDVCSPRDAYKSTTDDSSRNMSIEEVDTVFSDSTADLEQLEKEYRELARSNLQREYKSDGDTLDEIGKKRDDFQKWKNQSFETNFELYGAGQSAGTVNSSEYLENADQIEVLERIDSFDRIETIDDHPDFDCEHLQSAGRSDICSPLSHVTYSTTNSSENSSTKRADETKYFFSRIGNVSKENLSKLNSPRESDTSTLTSPIKFASAHSSSCSDQRQSPIKNVNAAAATISSNSNPILPCLRPSKLDIIQNVVSSPKEGTFSSLFEKRFGKLKKINKLIKSKRFSASALYDRQKSDSKPKSMDSNSSVAASTVSAITAPTTLSQSKEKTESTNRLFRSKCSPGKSSNSESKSSIYSSKLSLFSSKTAKASIFQKKSPMFTTASHSNNELNMRTSSKTTLNEISKSNSEINKYKFSPSRFSMKRSMKEKKPNSAACLYKEPSHSPLSEEFYNKTGSVRLSAMELYEKFCSEDFSGLYKHELSKLDERSEGLCGGYRNWHEYRLEHRGLGAVKKYARGKTARLLKQKSEPKFTFRADKVAADYDPKEEDEEDFYNQEQEYYEDDYDEEDEQEQEEEEEEEQEYEDELDEEDEHSDYYGPEDDIDYTIEPPLMDYGIERMHCHRLSEMLEEADEESDVNDEYEQRAYHLENDETCGIVDIANNTDSDVDEIYLMPEGGKCSDYEQYGFENKQFSLEHSIISRIGGIEHDLTMIDDIPYCDDPQPQFAYSSKPTPECYGSDEVLTVYKMYSNDDLLTVKEDDEYEDGLRPPSQNQSTTSDNTEPGCSSVEYAVNEYVKNAPPDISVDIESSDLKTDACTVIERAESMELLSGSSGTIRSGSTLTGYDFDTVKNLNLDSCSTSKLSLSLKSDGFEEFTLTPDEPKRVKNADAEDFTLTPEASVSEAPIGVSTTDDADTEFNLGETMRSDSIFEQGTKNEDGSISSNEVLVIVDKFLTNERLLQQNLNIVPIPNSKLPSSTLMSPVDSDASSTNALIERQSGTMFNISSSSKSTLDDALELDANNLDEDFDFGEPSKTNNDDVSTFTTELTKEFDLLFTRAQQDIDDKTEAESGTSIQNDDATNDLNNKLQVSDACTTLKINLSTELTPPPPRMPSRYSMQKLEPYFFADDITNTKENNSVNCCSDTFYQASDAIIATISSGGGISEINKPDHCKALDGHESSFIQKKIISKLKKNRSQSLGNLNKKTRCFPL